MIRANRKLVCVDFDGVLHSHRSGWRGVATIPDPPVPGAMAWLVDVADVFDLAIYSTRSASWRGRRAMRGWLRDHMARYMFGRLPSRGDPGSKKSWRYCANRARVIVEKRIQWPKTKPPAWVTLDDRCIRFRGVFPSDSEINGYQAWNMRYGEAENSRGR